MQNKEVYAERVKRSANQYVVVTLFQRTYPEDWVSSNENNNFSKMKTSEQWNYGDGQRDIMPSIKKGITSYEKAADLHLIMHLHTMHKLNPFATKFSPKPLIFL